MVVVHKFTTVYQVRKFLEKKKSCLTSYRPELKEIVKFFKSNNQKKACHCPVRASSTTMIATATVSTVKESAVTASTTVAKTLSNSVKSKYSKKIQQ